MFHQLSQEERYLIARGRAHHWSLRSIAMVLGRAPSTLSREVRRNAKDYDGVYRAKPAHSYAVAMTCPWFFEPFIPGGRLGWRWGDVGA